MAPGQLCLNCPSMVGLLQEGGRAGIDLMSQQGIPYREDPQAICQTPSFTSLILVYLFIISSPQTLSSRKTGPALLTRVPCVSLESACGEGLPREQMGECIGV